MEIETAVRRHLLALPSATGYVSQRVYKFSLLDHVQGTQQRAIVVRRSNGWASPDTVQSSEYPILVVDFWADPTRDEDGNKVADDAVDKAYAVFRAVDKDLHAKRDEWWGAGGTNPGLRVISCARWAEPFHMTGQDQHGSGPKFDGVPMGDCGVVVAQYAIHTTH